MGRLAGQVAVVTGASRGIGFAIARQFCSEGGRVVLASQNAERGQEALDRLTRQAHGQAIYVQTDITDSRQVAPLIERCVSEFGPPRILVNNAGVHDQAPFTQESEALWDGMYRVNVMGTALVSQAVVPHMKQGGGGSIVNIASKAGVVGEPGHTAYSASKGAVIAMTRGMAIELAPYRIRVNAICPGPVDTDILRRGLPTKEERDTLAAQVPLGRIGSPEDVAYVAVYLASEESAWCTGQALSVDGGMSVLK